MKKVAVFNDTSLDRHYGCDAVMTSLVEHLLKHNLKPEFFWPVSRDWRTEQNSFNLSKFDCIIVNGEGTIHDTITRHKARALLEIADLGFLRAKPSFLINATIYNIQPEDYVKLRKFTKVFVREQRSLRLLIENGVDAEFAPDLSFTAPKGPAPDVSRSGTLFTDSVIPAMTEKLLALSITGGKYIPVQVDQSRAAKLALRVANGFRRRIGLPGSPRPTANYRPKTDYLEFIRVISNAHLLVTGRFHAVTLCLATNTPFIAISSNTPKIESLLEDALGSTSRILNNVEVLERSLSSKTAVFGHFTASERVHLDKYIEALGRTTNEMFKTIARMS